MPKFNNPLDNVQVAAPCSANWEEMNGTEQKRFCAMCQLNVYNLSAMTKNEAEKLISDNEDRLCVRFYRRSDGTIITQNCPKGIAALKRRLSRLSAAALSAAIAFLSGFGVSAAFSSKQEVLGERVSPFNDNRSINKSVVNIPKYEQTMGNIAVPIQGKVPVSNKSQSDEY